MRGIKFRAWDKTTEEMLQVKALILAENTLLGCGGKPHIFDEHNDLHPLNEVALMRYTGLEDINGKEIYEGDIVYDHAERRYLEVFWREIGAGGWWFAEKIDGESRHVISINLEHLEVNGNIYENPELL
jgi:uncharacterized phage protein (TIGR01671 family)